MKQPIKFVYSNEKHQMRVQFAFILQPRALIEVRCEGEGLELAAVNEIISELLYSQCPT